ncbi:MAG: transposase [Shimia sp.]|nr:transposase [Shimia sp.]
MLFGIQASQDVKLSNIARSLQEEIPLIKTENRLSRNLKVKELESELTRQLVKMGSQRIETNTVLALDLSDIRKEYAKKMEHLAPVRDGSTGELHDGYWLCDVTGAEVHSSEIVPLYQKLYSAEAADFTSENAEILRAIDLVRTHTQRRGIWAIDRGGDRKKLLEPLLEWGERFVIRSMGKRSVIDRRKLRGSVAEVAGKCRLRHQAQIIKIHDGVEETLELRYGAEPIRLPDRDETLLLVVVSGFGQRPLMLLTNLSAARDSSTLWWIVQVYLTRWKIEETFRFIKQSYNLEDIRVLKYQRLKNLVVLVTAAAYFAATFLGQKMKLRILCEKLLVISQRFFGIPPFRFYALADGIRQVLAQTRPNAPPELITSRQLELALVWET